MRRALIPLPLNAASSASNHSLCPPTIFRPSLSPDATIQIRLCNGGHTLEFRYLFTAAVPDRTPSTWDFDNPLICPPVVWESPEGLMVVFCLTEGRMYRFAFAAPWFFAEVEEEEELLEEWSLEDWGFETIKGERRPFFASSLGPKEGLVVACEDGTVWVIERDLVVTTNQWHVSQLSYSSGLNPFTALASRFSSHNISDMSSPDLLLDMVTTHTSPPFLFAITRSRRIRVWDLNTHVCIYNAPDKKESLLPSNRRKMLRVALQQDGSFAMVLYNPTEHTFSLQLANYRSQGVGSLIWKDVGKANCDFEPGIRECVDFVYRAEEKEILTLWDEPESVGGVVRIFNWSTEAWQTIRAPSSLATVKEGEDESIEEIAKRLPAHMIPTTSEAVLKEDEETGEPLYALLEEDIREEWRKWSAIVEQKRRSELVPLSFAAEKDGVILLREGWGVLCDVEEEEEEGDWVYDWDVLALVQEVEKNGLEETAAELVGRMDGVEELEPVELREVEECLKELGSVPAPHMEVEEEGQVAVSWEHSLALESVLGIMIDRRWSKSRKLICRLVGMYAREEAMDKWEESFSAAISVHHTWSALRWLKDQPVEFPLPPRPNTEAIPQLDAAPVSLLHYLLLTIFRSVLAKTNSSAEDVALGVASFFAQTDLLTPKRLIVASPSDVKFAYRLFQLGLFNAALQWTEMFPGTAGMKFVKGLAEVELGRLEDAREDFERAASGVCTPPVISFNASDSIYLTGWYIDENEFRFDDDTGLLPVLNHTATASLARFYAHVAGIFEPKEAHSQTAYFSRLALDVWSAKDGSSTDLWSRLFRSIAQLGEFDRAYEVLMAMPSGNPDIRPECLRNLVSFMCESGATDQLLKYSFGGLVKELEQTLDFRARNSDTLSTPNYYRILYAYHISKADYRNAALAMYLHAQRIENTAYRSADPRRPIRLQTQSYLAAINALSLVEPKEQAWIPVNIQGSKMIGKRKRKLQYVIPDSHFSKDAVKIDVVEVEDIRKEYTMAVSRLQLADDYPELLQRSNPLTPDVVVSLLAETEAYETAFSVAARLEEDMSNIFAILAEKCLRLGVLSDSQAVESNLATWVTRFGVASTWQGSYAARGWRILQSLLQRYDSSRTNWTYHSVVLMRILEFDRSFNIPNWLIEFYLERFPDHFIRSVMKFNLLRTAFEFSIRLVSRSQNSIALSPPTMNGTTYLPHNSFDLLLSLTPEDGELAFPSALSQTDLQSLKKRLSEALKNWIASLKRIEDGLAARAKEKMLRHGENGVSRTRSMDLS
ncbi:hypothetical protein BT69DRAFT_1350037 [Atractiella rhizophila]|nr:hypothetical protein BT69DRAFT_1350037 [Atractiella rhizophila]